MSRKFLRLNDIQAQILEFLLGQDENYGLEVMKALNEGLEKYDLPAISYGKFYPNLKKLDKEGLLDSRWGEEVSGGARRRYYRINGNGRDTLRANREYERWVSTVASQPGLVEEGA